MSILGILIIIFGIALTIDNVWFRVNAIETRAVVFDYYSREGEDSTLYSALFEFYVNDVRYEGRSSISSKASPKIGKEIKVYYKPKNPDDFREGKGYFDGGLVTVFGAIFFGLGGGAEVFDRIWKSRLKKI